MTAELPSPNGLPLAPPRARIRPLDWPRLRHYHELRETMADPISAFAQVVLHPDHGWPEWRGKPSVPREVVARLWGRFCARCVPAEHESSRAAIALDAATFAPKAWDRVKSLVGSEDGPVALAASKFALGAVGVGDKPQGQAAAVFTGPAQVVFTFAAAQKAKANGSGA